MAKPLAAASGRHIFIVMKALQATTSVLLAVFLLAMPLAATSHATAGDLPETAPVPVPRPPTPGMQQPALGTAQTMPAAERTCRQHLEDLGVVFEEAEPIAEPEGCAAPHPVEVSRLSPSVLLEPEAILTCAMAEASARFVADHASPAAEETFDAPIASIGQVSSYVCRPRNGSAKLSEHAFANALDWGTVELADGTRIDIRAHGRSEPRRTRFVEALRQAACGPFRTVLGPGSDADHADHFHFDMAERRNGGTFCQ